MDSFTIQGENGYIKITISEVYGFPKNTSHYGGYNFKGTVKIKSRNFFAEGSIYCATGLIEEFYNQVSIMYKKFEGTSSFRSEENELSVNLEIGKRGEIKIIGSFEENYPDSNLLKFEIVSNQSYLPELLDEMQKILSKYSV